MGFINQFPYSDFHELNLDWLIKQTKSIEDQIKALEEELAKIEVMTEDQIKALINQAIASNNVQLYNSMAQLKADITTEYKNYVDGRVTYLKNLIDQLEIYVDNQDIYYFNLGKTYSDDMLVQAKSYTDEKVLDYTLMINPITGTNDDVRKVVNDIFSNFLTNDSLTAGEYDALDLTASAYDAYDLTAYDYDFNGKNLLV